MLAFGRCNPIRRERRHEREGSAARSARRPVPHGLPSIVGRDREFLPAALEILETPPAPLPVALMLTICQQAAVKVDVFPFARFGVLHGKVIRIATQAVHEQDAKRTQADATAASANSRIGSQGNSDRPPSTLNTCPLMNFARGPARKATASAISSGSA